MKQFRKFSTVFLSLMLVLSLSLSSFASAPDLSFEDWQSDWEQHISNYAKISIAPGKDETEMGFAWVTMFEDKNPAFKYGREADLSDAVEAELSIVRTPTFYYSHKVTLTDLTPGTWYYTYRTDNKWQEISHFNVYDPSDGFQLMYCSDVQTGRSGDEDSTSVLQNDSYGWYTTLNAASKVAPDYNFILNGGDQVQTALVKNQWNLLLAPSYIKSTPMATTIGNHELGSSLYHHHFNNPNNFKDTTFSMSGYPYYFVYGDVLFIVLDSNLRINGDHDELLLEAVKAHPEAKWRVAMLHHSLYGKNNEKPELQKKIAPLFDKYSIDLALSGHEHMYARSYPIKGGKVVEDGGTVYLAAGSASGSNMNHATQTPDYVANGYDFHVPSFCILDFEENSIGIKTYRSDNLEMVDEYLIEKDASEAADIPESGAGFFHKILNWFVKNILDRFMPYISDLFNYDPII